MASRLILPFADVGNGISPSDGAKLFFFDTQTSTPKDTFTDEALTVPNTNPVIANADGVFSDIWIADLSRYKVTLKDKNDVQIWEADPVVGGLTTSVLSITNINFTTVAAMVADTTLSVGDFISIENYTATNNSGVMFGKVVAAGTGTADGGEYIDLPNTLPDPLQFKQNFQLPVNAKMYGIEGDGTTELTQIAALEAYSFANKQSVYFPHGTYDVGDANWPFRQQVVSGLKDYEGVVISGAGKDNTIFRTTSVAGADVLQLNAVKDISFRDLSVTAVLTGFAGAGSNGVSITNGGENIHVDVDAFECPGIDKGSFLDGGKAYTIQNGANTNDFTNISIKGQATNCAYLFEKSTPYDEFDIGVSPIYSGITVDVIGRDCWRGISLGAAAATVAIADTEKDCGVSVFATLINCAQPLGLTRWVRGDVDVKILNTKVKASLFRPFAADQTVYGTSILGDYHSRVKVSGTMEECDSKLIIGGISQGGGIYGGSDGTEIDFELDSTSVLGTTVDVINSGGNSVRNATIRLAKNVVAALPSPTDLLIAANDNRVFLGGKLTGSFTGTLLGVTTSPTGNFEYSINGDVVTIEVPQITGTSNSTFTTITAIPTDIRVTGQQNLLGQVQDNGVGKIGRIVIETDGTITLYNGVVTAGGWTASGSKGVLQSVITYRRS